ncbi:hypothetical protein ACFLXK_00365 [Chloroflexota bacterium]
MIRPRKLLRSSFHRIFGVLITIVLLFGSLPVPVQAETGQLDHFDFSFIENQAAGIPFTITITAKDSDNVTVTTYNGTNTLSDRTGTISPSQTGAFNQGVWTGNVTIDWSQYGIVINTTGDGKQDTSNSFDITSYGFHIESTQGSFMLSAGESIQVDFDVVSDGGFAGTVDLQFYGPPDIESVSSLDTGSILLSAEGTETVSLTLGASTGIAAGAYNCRIGGTSGNFDDEFFLIVNIGATGQPLLSVWPSVVSVDENVTFSVSQFTANASVEIKWDSGPFFGDILASGTVGEYRSWMSDPIVINDTDPPGELGGDYDIKATSSAGDVAFSHITVTSGQEEGFLVYLSPNFLSLQPGNTANVDIKIQSVNSFSSPVTLSADTPEGVNCSFNPSTVTPMPNGEIQDTMTLTLAEWVNHGMYYVGVNCDSSSIHQFRDLTLDIYSSDWGPSISLSENHGQAGDLITITGSNFMASKGEILTIREMFSGEAVNTQPAVITITQEGTFSAQIIVPDIPAGYYRLEAKVDITEERASEKDFQVLESGATFSVSVSPWSANVITESGNNTDTVNINLFSMGTSVTVNLYLESFVDWLTYNFGTLADNIPASGADAITVPAGGSNSIPLNLTVSMSAPAGNYNITIKAEDTSSLVSEFIDIELIVMPPSEYGMAGISLDPDTGEVGDTVSIQGWGFTPNSNITAIEFGGTNVSSENISVSASGSFFAIITVPDQVFGNTTESGWYPIDVWDDSGRWGGSDFTVIAVGQTFTMWADPGWLGTINMDETRDTKIKVESFPLIERNSKH